MKEADKKSHVFLGISVFILLIVFFWGNPDFDDLKYIEGKVINVLVKEKRSGAFVSVQSAINDEVVTFNFESVPEKTNQLVRNFMGNEYLKLWYLEMIISMKYDSVEPWQVEYNGNFIVSYQDTKEGHTLFKYFLYSIFFVFLFPGLWFFFKGK